MATTGQTLLNIMEDLNGELQLQSGEVDVAKGLRALNAAQDLFEAVMATHSRVSKSLSGTVTTTANTETTTYPTGLLRLDSLWYVDTSLTPNRPGWKLRNLRESGTTASYGSWIASLASSIASGKPRAYFTDGTKIYWDPIPDAVYTVRWYGFQAAADITASAAPAYEDLFNYPLALLASRILKTSLDDPPDQFITLAKDMFNPLIDALSGFNRDGATGMVYEYRHDT